MRANHFRLITLGRLTLLGPSGEEEVSIGRRLRKLAVLAVLALSRRPVSRDSLVEMFWPEEDGERARHSLSNALSELRRTLGARAINARDTHVSLDSELLLSVDAVAFAEAVDGRDYAHALTLYGGGFLDNYYMEGSVAFEQWAMRERRRLEAMFAKACSAQCALLSREGRWDEVHAIAARWCESDPTSPEGITYLLNATRAPGTRRALSSAIEEYETLRQRLQTDLDVPPPRVAQELAARIREDLNAMGPATIEVPEPTSAPLVQEAPAIAAPAEAPTASPVEQAGSDSEVAPSATPVPFLPPLDQGTEEPTTVAVRLAPRPRARVLMVAAVAAMAVVVSVAIIRGDKGADRRGRSSAAKPIIAVLDAQVRTGDSSAVWLAQGLPQMILGKLSHNASVEVIRPENIRAVIERSGADSAVSLSDDRMRDIARRVGATMVAHGTLTQDGKRLVLELSMMDVASGARVQSAVLSGVDALAVADEAAVRILGAVNIGAPGPQFSDLETTSVEAYQHFMKYLDVGRAGRITEAKRELDLAIALDSGFIPAVRARIFAAIGDEDAPLVERLRATLLQHADRFTEFDRLDDEVNAAFYSGRHEESEALARETVRRYPRDPRAYTLLQRVLSSHGKFAEALSVAERALALDSLAIDAGTGPCSPCLGLESVVGLRWVLGDLQGAADRAHRWIRAQPDGASAWSALAWTYSYMQRPDSALLLMRRTVALASGEFWATEQWIRMLLVARQYELADSAIRSLETSTPGAHEEAAVDLRAQLLREQGRAREAEHLLQRYLVAVPASRRSVNMYLAPVLRSLGDNAGAAQRYHELVHAPNEGPVTLPVVSTSARGFCWHHALVADAIAADGSLTALQASVDTLSRGCTTSYYGRDWKLHHHVLGLLALREGRYADAERELTAATWSRAETWGRTTVELARAQLALGKPVQAVATLRDGYVTRLDAMGRYVTISEFDYWMSRAFAQAGATDSARTYSRYVRRAWAAADPEVKRLLADLPTDEASGVKPAAR
ncbi:MAG: BTAD domain-containing putative transcriptional regulator [Gemmatimonadaceae bacterium]